MTDPTRHVDYVSKKRYLQGVVPLSVKRVKLRVKRHFSPGAPDTTRRNLSKKVRLNSRVILIPSLL